MGNTIQKSDSAFGTFLQRLRKAGVQDKDIDGTVADDALGGPGMGKCKVPEPGDGKVDRSEVFALALNNLTSHGDTVRRFFQQIGFSEIDQLQNDGQFGKAYRKKVENELLGSAPQRSLKAWPNPDKLKAEDPRYGQALAAWSLKHTRMGLLPFNEQLEVFRQFGLQESAVKGELSKHWQDLTLPKILAQASLLKGEDLIQEARDRRRVGGLREAQELEGMAHRLFQTAVEMDGKNPEARLRLGESLEAKEKFSEAGLHYAQAIVDGVSYPEVEKILERLSYESGREMLGKHRDAFGFVGANLALGGRYLEAAALYHQAAEAATAAGQHKKSLSYTEFEMRALEKVSPYVLDFGAETNPVAHRIYQVLREAGVPSAYLDGASGKEGDLPDHKISDAEVFGYLDSHFDEKRVKDALSKAGLELPWLDSRGKVRKEFATEDFTRLSLSGRFGAWHEAQAKRLQADGLSGDEGLIEKHLKMAAYFEPGQARRHQTLGDFYLSRKDGAQAKTAYSEALKLDPTQTGLSLSMARSLALTGEHGEALKSYQSYLQAHPGDGKVQAEADQVSSQYLTERSRAFDGQLAAFKLLSATHPKQAAAALVELEKTLIELESMQSSGPEQTYDRLKRSEAYYQAAIDYRNSHTPTLSFWDRTAYDSYQAKTAELEKQRDQVPVEVKALLEGEVRPRMIEAGTVGEEELAMARLALRIDREVGDYVGQAKDMETAIALVEGLPGTVSSEEKAEHYAALLHFWSDPENTTRNDIFTKALSGLTPRDARNIDEDLKTGILNHVSAAQQKELAPLLEGVLSGDFTKGRDYLQPGGLKKYSQELTSAAQAFAEAKALEDPQAQRGAYLGVLSSYVKLGRSADVDAVLNAVDASFPEKAKGEDKLHMTTALLSVLQGSGLPQEKKLRAEGDILARQMAVCSSDPRVNVKRRMAELTYYSTVGDTKGREEAERGLSQASNDLLNYLHAGHPDAGIPKPTDAKTRIELVTLAVEIDLALLGSDAAQASDPKSKGAISLSVKIPRLELLQRELAKAGDLPPEDRLAALSLLSRASSAYQPLTQGEAPLLTGVDLKKLNEGTDKLMSQAFDELLQQPEGASFEQVKMGGKIAEDFKLRYRAAVKAGDQAWLSNIQPESIREFAEYSQGAHALMLEAESLKGPRGFERRLQAAKIFSELGLGSRVKESLEPVRLYADALQDPQKKAGFLLTLAQLYQSGGQKDEADLAFRSIEALGGPGASPALRETATLATGLRQLNAGDTQAAHETLASIPENPTAQILLGALRQSVESRRLGTSIAVLRSVSLNFLEKGKEATFGGFSESEYESLKRDTLAGWDEVHRLVASGEASNLEHAISVVGQDSRFKGFRTGFSPNYGADPHTSDTSEYHIASFVGGYLSQISNPALSDRDFSEASLELAGMVSSDGYFTAKAGILNALQEDPYVGTRAKDGLEGLPTEIKVRTGIGIAWNVVSFAAGPAGILGANSTSGAGGGDYIENVAMALIPFGVARSFAVGAEAVYVARAATLIRNPTLFKAGGFLVGKSAEAAGFALGNMAMLTLLKGKTDQWTLQHFGQEFGVMLVTFALLHGAGMALKGAGNWSGRAVARAEADMARAMESGAGLSAASFRLRFANGVESVAKNGVTSWGTRVLAFTGSEYFNEAIGLKSPEPGIPFWARLLSSAVMDAQMIVAGRSIDALSGGRIGKIEKSSHQKYGEHELGYETQRLLPVVQGMGFDPASPAGRQALQTLLASRYSGESFTAVQKRAETDKATYEKIVQESLGLDPKSSEGRDAMTLLLGYAQNHPFAGPGRPLAAAEVAKHGQELFETATKLLQGAGLETGGAPMAGLRRGLVAFALRTGMEPALLASYAKQAATLKPSLKKAAEAALGAEGVRTPEGQALIGELLVFAMFRAGSPEKMSESLEPLLHLEMSKEIRGQLRGQAEAVFGKAGAETPAGRQLMSFLFLRAVHSADSLAELPLSVGVGRSALAHVPILADVSGFSRPAERVALARWVVEKGFSPDNVVGLTRLVIKGRTELRNLQGQVQVLRVPENQRVAKIKEVLDRLPELPPELLKADRAAERRTEEEIFPITDDMIFAVEPLKPATEEIIPITDDMILPEGDTKTTVFTEAVTRVVKAEEVTKVEEVIPVTDDMILPEGGTKTKVYTEGPTRVVKGSEVTKVEKNLPVADEGAIPAKEKTEKVSYEAVTKVEKGEDVTKREAPPKSPARAKTDPDGTKVLRKKSPPVDESETGTQVEGLAARAGGLPVPKPGHEAKAEALGDSRTADQVPGAKLESSDGKLEISLDFLEGNVLYLGGRAGLREASASLETLDSPQAEIALVKIGKESAFRIKALSKGKVEYFDSAKQEWQTVTPEGHALKSGQKLRIGGEEFYWEPSLPRLHVGTVKTKPLSDADYDALFEARKGESTHLVSLVETLNTGPVPTMEGWTSSSADLTLPNLAYGPVLATWKHFSKTEARLDLERNGVAYSAIAEYQVEIRGEQRMADTIARLKADYGERLVPVKNSDSRYTEFVLQGSEGQGVIRIVLSTKAFQVPSVAEAREVFTAFEKDQLPDLMNYGKESGLRGRYALSIMEMVGYEQGADGKTVFGKRLEAAIHRYEKGESVEERARGGEELARMVAYLRDVPMLKAEETLIHRSGQLRDFSEIGRAIKWLEASDSPAGKKAWEEYSQLAKLEMDLRNLSQELFFLVPPANRKPGNPVYDEYLATRESLDKVLGGLEKLVKDYEGSEAYVKDMEAKARSRQYENIPKEEPVTGDKPISMDGEPTKVGKTPPKSKKVGASDQGVDLRHFNPAEVAWLGAFGVAGAEKLASPQGPEYGQTLFNGVELLLKSPRGDISHYEWALTRLVGALRHTAHAEGGTWETWLKETLEPTLAAHGRGIGGAKLPGVKLSAEHQSRLDHVYLEINPDNVLQMIDYVKTGSTRIPTRKYPKAFAPDAKGAEILGLAMQRFGPFIRAQDPALHAYLEGIFPKAKGQAYPGADPGLPHPEAARAGSVGALATSKVELDARQGLGADLATFLGTREFLAHSVSLTSVEMTPKLRAELKAAEVEFEKGGMVFEHQGRPLFMRRLSGAETMMTENASPELVEFYQVWKSENSFSAVDSKTAHSAYAELKARLDRLGIKLQLSDVNAQGNRYDLKGEIEHHGGVLVYVNELVKLLPDSMLSNLHMKEIHLNVARQGPGLLSSYDPATGSAYLYTGSFTGGRRYMAALLLHELGHSTAERYSTGSTGDSSIPLRVRQDMAKAHRRLVNAGGMLGLDWAVGAKHRADYQASSFTEFMAELNLTYVVAGPKLRQHIASFPEGTPARKAWELVYSELRDRVFGGLEYDYQGVRPAAENPALKVVSAAPKAGEPYRDYIPIKEMPDASVLELVLSPGLESTYKSPESYLLIPGDPSISQPQLFGVLMKKGTDLWFSPQLAQARVFTAEGKAKGLRGSQSPLKLVKGDMIEVGLFKFKFDGVKLQPDGTVEMRRVDPAPTEAPRSAEGVLQDNQAGAARKGTYSRGTTAEYGSVSVHTDEGVGYKAHFNEDGFVQGSNWAIVLDGMGGMGGGDQASAVAGREFQRLMEDPSYQGTMAEAMVLAGRKVNEEVNGGAAQSGQSGTAAVAHRVRKQADGSYQVELVVSGDAGAIIFRPEGQGTYVAGPRTQEQSLVGEFRRMGEIKNTLVARRNPQANIVTDGLGLNKDAKPISSLETLHPGDRLLMFSDGVGDSFSKEELAYLLSGSKNAEEAQTKIVEAAHTKMSRLQDGKEALRKGRGVVEIQDGQNSQIGVVPVDGLSGYWMDRSGTVYGRVVEFRDGSGARKYGVEVPWAKGRYYYEDASGEGKVVAGTFSADRGYYGAVDKYKADNLTVSVYFHDVAGTKTSAAKPKSPAVTDPGFRDAKTQVYLKPGFARQESDGSWSFSLLDKQNLALGRNPGKGQVELADPSVSRKHAEIFLNQGEYWIRDLGSLGGTTVNGQRIGADHSLVLTEGALIQMGKSQFTFHTKANGSLQLTPRN